MLLLPLMAGAGFLALMLAGGKKAPKVLANGDIDVPLEDKKKAAKAVTKAAEKKDWPSAIANALASGSSEVISALAKRLEKEGLTAQAKDLRGAFAEMQQLARDAQKKKPAKKPAKKAAKAEEVKTAKEAKPTPKPAAKPAAKPAPKPTKATPKPAAKPGAKAKKAKAAEPTGPKKTAIEMREMLLKSKRYSEDKVLVGQVQKNLGLSQDGKYGPGTAKAQWDKYQIVPANPYYWPSTNTAQTVSTYKAWLASLKPRVSASEAAAIDKLLPTVGK